MFPKLSLSLAAALALATAVSPHSPTNEEIDAAETGNPDSVDYANRKISSHSPTNAEIDAAETGNPDSLAYGSRPDDGADRNWKAEWQALDADLPANPQPGKGVVSPAPAKDPAVPPPAR